MKRLLIVGMLFSMVGCSQYQRLIGQDEGTPPPPKAIEEGK